MPHISRRFAIALGSAALAAPALGRMRKPAPMSQWDTFEIAFPAPQTGNPFMDTSLTGHFTCGSRTLKVAGFYDGDGIWRLRFLPDQPGQWHFRTTSNAAELNNKIGTFDVAPPAPGVHGPVLVSNTYHFSHSDGTPFWPLGTTSYAWTHQSDDMVAQTLKTLAAAPFNKLRFAIFPNGDTVTEPLYPFPGKPHDWDYTRFNPAFFRRLDFLAGKLRDLDIQADIILFHPYDGKKWGFDAMPPDVDDRYVRYVTARLSAYRNVWWSLANEFDDIKTKTDADFDRLFQVVRDSDPYNHLRSIHHNRRLYDYSKPWVTHASLQNGSAVEDDARAVLYRDVWRKPVVFDEVKYEGNIAKRWGNLSGQEMVRRVWEGTIAGTYVGHGESIADDKYRMFLGEGGKLKGESIARLAFFRRLIEEGPFDIDPIDKWQERHLGGVAGRYYLRYFGNETPHEWAFVLPKDSVEEGARFAVEVIDTWNMTVTPVAEPFMVHKLDDYSFTADRAVPLPARPYIALRIKKIA